MAAAPPAPADDQAPSLPPLFGRRRALLLGIAGVIAYLLALIATLPARFAIDLGSRWTVAGTVWDGEAVLDGAYRLEWRWAPWRSLAGFAFASDVRLTGAGTDIAGTAARSGSRLTIEGLAGRADGALLNAFAFNLPFACDATMAVDIPRAVLDGAHSLVVGEIRADGAVCGATGAAADSEPLPPLLMRAVPAGDTTLLTLAPVGRSRLALMEGSIARGHISLGTTKLGASLIPFARALRIEDEL